MFGRFEQDKHYALNNTSFNLDCSIKMSLDYLDYSNKSLYVSVSNSVGVFKMQGADLNFIHGGISPQNIVIPVLTGLVKESVSESYISIVPDAKRNIE